MTPLIIVLAPADGTFVAFTSTILSLVNFLTFSIASPSNLSALATPSKASFLIILAASVAI